MLVSWHKSCVKHLERETSAKRTFTLHYSALHHKSTDIFLENTFHTCKSYYYQKGLKISLHGCVKYYNKNNVPLKLSSV